VRRFAAFLKIGGLERLQRSEDARLVLTGEETEIRIERLVGMNVDFAPGSFLPTPGVHVIGPVFLKVSDRVSFTRVIPVYHHGIKVCEFDVLLSSDSGDEAVFFVTEVP
jgi:hypothetical protein